jgi:hypothetical protein
MKWVTRARPVIDRLACPWLIARFIAKEAEFLSVAPDRVRVVAKETGAIPYDVPGVELSHVGEGCSFDAFLAKYRLEEPALHELARIVLGADTERLDLTPQIGRAARHLAGPALELRGRPRGGAASRLRSLRRVSDHVAAAMTARSLSV